MMATVFDERVCTLGEGALWHPLRQQLFWFDIIGKKLLSQSADGAPLAWQFDEHVSAAGWIDYDTLLIASESALLRFRLDSGESDILYALEADNPVTRSNDGRADPWGGFWIGTMGKKAQAKAGAIYRFYCGELRRLVAPVTIPNAICFSPDGHYAYYSDTVEQIIWRQRLDSEQGWPTGEPEALIDCAAQNVFPDGAVTDRDGNIWNAQWGSARVACYSPDGKLLRTIAFPATQVSCPAFGGADLTTLFATSATENLDDEALRQQPEAGWTFQVQATAGGNAEHPVVLL